ncbi:MAG: hypothetical protein B6242_11820 [Anaerolineaceae bacterium 4572_78]|nr:MAG: hypothetical protein B6242_11820 [Anaerolineaceae bacterium 4572_78]
MAIGKLSIPISVDIWIEIMQQAVAETNKLPPFFLSVVDIAILFNVMLSELSEQENDLLIFLFKAQNKILANIGPVYLPELKAITELSQKLMIIANPDKIVKEGLVLVSKLFKYHFVNVFSIKGANHAPELQTCIIGGKTPSEKDIETYRKKIRVSSSIIRQVVVKGTSQISSQKHEIATPLLRNNKMVGILHVFNSQENQFGSHDITAIEAVATQLMIAVKNARLQKAVRRRVHEQKVLLEANNIFGSSLDVERVTELVALKIADYIRASACVISRWSEESKTITSIFEHVPHPPHPSARSWRYLNKAIPLDQDPISQQVLKSMRPLVIHSKQDSDNNNRFGTYWQKHGWTTLLALPLETHGQKMGILELYDHAEERFFTSDDIHLAQALANQATIAIERAELFNETKQRLKEVSALYTLSMKMGMTLDLDELLNNIVVTLQKVLDRRACILFLLDETGEYLEIKAACGMKDRLKKTVRFKVGEGVAGTAVAEQRAIYIPDTYQTDFLFFDTAVRSLIVVPMMYQGRVIGALNMDDSRPYAFGTSQEQLLSIMATQIAISIENVKLFNQILSEKQRTSAIIEHMPGGLLMLNSSRDIVEVNPALAIMLNIDMANIIGQHADSDILDPRLGEICAPATIEVRPGVKVREVTMPDQKSTTLRVFSTKVSDEDDKSIGEVRVVYDITKEKQLESIKDEFVSTVSHELNTPLFTIQGFLRLLLDGEVPEPEMQQEFLQIMDTEANRLADMVRLLIEANKVAAGLLELETAPVQIIRVIKKTLRKLHPRIQQADLSLTVKLPPSMPIIVVDAQRMEQVITHVIDNAINFTDSGGRVTVTAERKDNSIVIAVSDTGIGIAENELTKVFDKFYQIASHSTRIVGGSGLGLYLAQYIVHKHNGKFFVKSELDTGSTFYIQLPLQNKE